eukprot:3760661-Prorocentrum_lima.AAC.1
MLKLSACQMFKWISCNIVIGVNTVIMLSCSEVMSPTYKQSALNYGMFYNVCSDESFLGGGVLADVLSGNAHADFDVPLLAGTAANTCSSAT